MLYSNACAYAVRALARLALIRPDGYVLLDELCQGSDLPRHFVAKIFQDLVRKGLLTSAKGRGGGFALARKPDTLSVADVVVAVDGPEAIDKAESGITESVGGVMFPLFDAWAPLGTQIRQFLENTTLDQLAGNLANGLTRSGAPRPHAGSPSKPLQRASA